MQNNLLICRGIKVPLSADFAVSSEQHDMAALAAAKKIYRRTLQKSLGDADFAVYKKSVDARKKDKIVFMYSVAVAPHMPLRNTVALPHEFESLSVEEPVFRLRRTDATARPVVVGFGPSGMLCAYALAKAGCRPIVLERGSDVDTRAAKVERYWKTGVLDTETNVQFGEGGAGTFSDGKLLSRISDPLCSYVLQILHAFGAPKEILYLAKPHIGTDYLRGIVKNLRGEILRLGGEVRFDSKLTAIHTDRAGRLSAIGVNHSYEMPCDALFLCIGHSARDTFEMLMESGVSVVPKPFSVGVRVEHLQRDIDAALYGNFAGHPALGVAQYALSAKKDGRAVYSFCMCPGGVVVASASANGEIVTNGMSYYARDGLNANSAIAVSVNQEDYGNTVQGAISFQHSIEAKAYALAGGGGAAPIMLLGDLLHPTAGSLTEPSRIQPTYTGKTALCDIRKVFPDFVGDMLAFGFSAFEKSIRGFAANDAVLTAPETRTSSPVRIERTQTGMSLSMPGLYPCGEGAGYAGGITSAAVDGLKSALAYLQREE